MNKLSNVLLKIFSYGVLITLFVGGLSVVGYIAALIIGGETATAICLFVFKTLFPWVIRICAVCVGCGLVGMYLNKQEALTMKTEDINKLEK